MRIALIAGLLLLALAGNAGAHGLDPSHLDTRRELDEVNVAATVNAVADDGGLPAVWCGTQRTTDDTANPTFDPALPQFKLVYVYFGTNRFDQWKDALQANVSLIGRFMGSQSGGTKAPRFDMGTSCGPQYADIMVVELTGTRSQWANKFNEINTVVRNRLGAGSKPRNIVVLADQLSNHPVGYWYGLGSYMGDDTPGAANDNNLGGFSATLFVPNGEPAPGNPANGWWPEGMLHEMTHNLGAVQDGAPHSTFDPGNPSGSGGHCWDGHDVMCYDDDANASTFPLTYGCDEIPGVMTQVYDCGNDDYFNVAPAAGSYLASAWNTYDNVFLGTCIGVAPACGGSTTGTALKPEATSPPEVLGTPKVGSSLLAVKGLWAHSPVAYAYQWQRGDGGGWTDVAGATGPGYIPTAADAGRALRIRVTATNGDGSTDAVSAATAAVADPASNAPPPRVLPPATPAGSTPARTAATRRPAARAALKVAVGRGKGKRLGTIGFRVAGGKVSASRARIRLARGRYEVALCTTAGASATVPRCAKKRFTAKRGKLKLPALAVAMPDGLEGRVTYAVTAVGRLFAARTAGRGVTLRG